MGWRSGDAGGVDREEEREVRPGEFRGESAEGEDKAVGMVSLGLGLGLSAFGVSWDEEDGEMDKEGSGLRVEGDEGVDFGVAGSSVSSSIAKNILDNNNKKNKTNHNLNLDHNHKDIQVSEKSSGKQ